jgi:hypothetical protein
VNKRLGSEADRVRLAIIKEDIFSKRYTPEEIVRKHFGTAIINKLDDLKANNIQRGVSFFDASALTVNNTIHTFYTHLRRKIDQVKTLENGITYYFGGRLTCRESLTLQNKKLHPNYNYKIIGMTKKHFTLQDELYDSLTFEVSHQQIVANFFLPYVNTVHSTQGHAIKEKFVITDWHDNLRMIDMQWLYTAITRCKRLSDVYFLEERLSKFNVDTIIVKMIAGYKYQDKRAKRPVNEETYVKPHHIKDRYIACQGRCELTTCGAYMTFNKHNKNKVSVNRLDNALGHEYDNFNLICRVCNSRLSDR